MLRIAVAEDEAVIRMDLVEMLVEAGYDVVGQAADGEAAVELVDRARPDVLLVDIAMPRLDGLEVTRRVAESTAVLIVSAFGQRTLAEQAAEAGAMGYLVKPVARSDLEPAIEVAAARWEAFAALRGEVADVSRRLAERSLVERAKGLLADDLGLSEVEAYTWLRRAAMDGRRSLGSVAADVIEGWRGAPASDDSESTR